VSLRVAPAFVGARGFDCVTHITVELAHALRTDATRPMDFAVRYLESLSVQEIADITGAGLAIMPVSYGNTPFTADEGRRDVAKLQGVGFPPSVTMWLDLEASTAIDGLSSSELMAGINARASVIQDAGYHCGLYVGAGQPLGPMQLWSLAVTAYWHALSRGIPEPSERGFCMVQLYPTTSVSGVQVDIDVIQQDFKGGLPFWAVAA
jgi:hypothetical protein